MKYNENFFKLKNDYVFSDLAQKVASKKSQGGDKIIDLGIGDVKLPLFKSVVLAMQNACLELGEEPTFRGYPPAQGYKFLRDKIAEEYQNIGANILADEIFITDGAKGQLGGILELFGHGAKTLFLTPCYPAGAEANILYGNQVTYLPAQKDDGFVHHPPFGKFYDLIFMCSPNNPTGTALDHATLSLWIDYAISTGAVIIYDSAYSAYLTGDYPKSIYSLPRANRCAIEINSFSKSLGFTGVRCGYNVIPNALGDYNKLWKRRLACRFNGVSYPSQRGAEAIFCAEGKKEAINRINFYKTNAEILKIALKNLNLWYNNNVCSPYVFASTPSGMSSADFCSKLLMEKSVVATPGVGFGEGGEGFFRLSAFGDRQEILTASDRLKTFKI